MKKRHFSFNNCLHSIIDSYYKKDFVNIKPSIYHFKGDKNDNMTYLFLKNKIKEINKSFKFDIYLIFQFF